VPKKCKSNGGFGPSGERSRNTWAICPGAGDNSPKGLLIPHADLGGIPLVQRLRSLQDEPAAYQLVGGVTAHQGYDG